MREKNLNGGIDREPLAFVFGLNELPATSNHLTNNLISFSSLRL